MNESIVSHAIISNIVGACVEAQPCRCHPYGYETKLLYSHSNNLNDFSHSPLMFGNDYTAVLKFSKYLFANVAKE